MPSLDVLAGFALTILLPAALSIGTFLIARKLLEGRLRFLVISPTRKVTFRLSFIRSWNVLFFAIVIAYVVVFSRIMLLKHQAYQTGYDFSIFDQVVWNSLNGRLLETSITHLTSSWLGTHFAPILLAFVPLYAIWDDPQMLLIFQTVAIASAALPLYWFARQRLGNLLAIDFTLVFFLFPAQQYVNLNDFHEIALAIPIFSFALFFLLRNRNGPFFVCLGLALLLREEVAFIVIAFGLWFLLRKKFWLGWSLVGFGVAWAMTLLGFVIPFFAGSTDSIVVGLHYSTFGASPLEVFSTMLTHPELVASQIIVPSKIEFILDLFAPIAFLSIIGLDITMLAAPTFGYLLLAGVAQASIHFQYSAPIHPFLFFGAMLGTQRILNGRQKQILASDQDACRIKLKSTQLALAVLILGASGISYYQSAPGPFAKNSSDSTFTPNAQQSTLIQNLFAQIPANAALLTYGGLTPHLTHRTQIYYLPFINDYRNLEYMLIPIGSCDWCKQDLERLVTTGYFEILSEKAGYFLAKRRPPAITLQIQYENQVSLVGFTNPATDTLRGGNGWHPILVWQADQPLLKHYQPAIRLVDPRGHLWAQDVREPQDGRAPTDKWRLSDQVFDQYNLRLPSTMPPGEYYLTASVFDPDSGQYLDANKPSKLVGDKGAIISALQIQKDKSSITASQLISKTELQNPFYVDMQELRLLGFQLAQTEIDVDATLSVGIFWRARTKPQGDYMVVVQLLDTFSQVAMEQKDYPAAGAYRTTQWDEGEVVLDWHDLTLQPSVSPGVYRLRVQLVDSSGGQVIGEALWNQEIRVK